MRITLKGPALKGFCYQLISAEGCEIQLYPFKSISYTVLQNNVVIAQNSKTDINPRTRFRSLDHPESAFFGSEQDFSSSIMKERRKRAVLCCGERISHLILLFPPVFRISVTQFQAPSIA